MNHGSDDDDDNNHRGTTASTSSTTTSSTTTAGLLANNLPRRSASTGTFATTSNNHATNPTALHHGQRTSTTTSRRSWLPPIRRGTSKDDVLSVSHPGFYPNPSSSSSNVIVPTLFVPLKSCLSHNQLDTLISQQNNHNHTTTTPMPANSMKKNVSFHQIEIREHCRTLGDNPSVSKGPALAMDWESCDMGSLSLDEYERWRPPRRNKSELAVPCHVRETMLRHEAGIRRSDMAAANRARHRHHRVRHRNNNNHHESTAPPPQPLRALQKLVLGGNKSSNEAATQRQVDELMELSRRVEHEREQQRQAYMAQVLQELSAQHQQQQQQEEEPDHQVPGQSTREEEKKESTTPPSTAGANDLQKILERSPSFLPNQEHADSWDDQSTDHLEF